MVDAKEHAESDTLFLDQSTFYSSVPSLEDEKETRGERRDRVSTMLPALVGASRQTLPALVGASCQVWRDVRAARWGRFALWVLYLCWLGMLLYFLIFVIGIAEGDMFSLDSEACRPDGTFTAEVDRFNWWGASGFFQMSLSDGMFTFTEVKVLDIAVQVVCWPSPFLLFNSSQTAKLPPTPGRKKWHSLLIFWQMPF